MKSNRSLFLKSPLARRKTTDRKGLLSGGSAVECLESRIAPAAALSVTKVAVFAPGGDLNGDGNFDPGDSILYTVTLNNTGDVDLTGVTFADILDGNLIQGANVNVSPLAINDTYSAVANTLLRVGNPLVISGPSANVAGHVTDNDAEFLGDTYTIVSFEAASANSGTVSMVTSGVDAGSFSYLPAVGFTGTDTFHYTIQDKGLDGIAGNSDDMTSVGTVTITVGAQKVWYVDSNYAGANGASDGRSNRPFTSLTALSTGGTADGLDGSGDIIFVHTGSGNYTSTIVLETSQTLQGQGTALTVGGFNLVTAGTAPILAPGAGTAVTLGSGNTLSGFTIGNSQRDIQGTNFGTLTVSNVTLNGSGKTLDLNNGTFAATSAFNSISTTGTSGLAAQGHGMQLINVHGTVNFGSTTIAGTEIQGIFVNASDANITFGNTSVGSPAGSGTEAIRFEANTGGTRSFGTLTLSASQTGGIGMSISDTGGTVSVSGTASISNVTSTGLSVSGGAAVSFGTLNLSAIGGNGIVLSSHNGTFNTGTGGTIQTVTGTDVSITGGTGAVTVTQAITNTTGGFIAIDNHETGNVTFSGNLSSTGGASGISLINSNTGTFTFSGDTKTLTTNTNSAVTLTNNGGATINFLNGGLAITTTSGAGINATGGGTISVTTGTNANTISSGTGTALTVANTNIGAGNLNFQRISSNGAANGIVLNTTGSAGGLIVTGTDGGDAGTVPDAGTGGTIQSSSGHGILLNSTENVRLGGMTIINNLGSGISGTTVNGFLLDGVTITGNGNDAGSDESGINIAELTGSASGGARPTGITNSTISNNNEFEVQITNTAGTLTNFQLNNNTISSNGIGINGNATSPHGNLVNFLALGSASMTLTTSGGTYTGNIDTSGGKIVTATALNVDSSGGSSSVFAQINGGTFLNNNVAVTVSTAAGGNLDFDVLNTSSTFSRSHALNLFVAANSTGTVTGSFQNNTIGTDNVENSASEVGFGIRVQNEGSTSTANPVTVQITNNTVRGMGSTAVGGFAAVNVNLGIASQAFTRTTNLTVTDNNIDDVYGNRGIVVQQNNTTAPGIINATITGNNLGANIAGNVGDATVIRMRQLAGGTFNLTQASLAALATANTVGGNTTTTAEISVGGTVTFGQAAPPLPLQFTPSAGDIDVTPPVDTGSPSDTGNTPTGGSGETPTTTSPDTTVPGGSTPIVIQPPVIVDDGILSQGELDSLVAAAIARWEATGLTQEQSALLHNISFTVADLPGWYLGEAGSNHITLDSNAAGNSWFIDATPFDDSEFTGSGTQFAATSNGGAAGRIDALTTIMHELGHVLGLGDSVQSTDAANLMYGFLHQGERRLPGANQAEDATPHLAAGDLEFAIGPINIGSLPVGKSVQIAFTGTIKNDIAASTVSNQGTASSTQTGNVLSDDPGVVGTANPTITAIDLPDVTVAIAPASVSEDSGGNLVYTFTRTGPIDFARTVNFSVGGSATFASDYTQSGAATFNATTGTVTFPIGASTVTVTLTPTADTTVEANETALLTVTTGSGYDVGTPAAATGTINNDDTDISVAVAPASVTEDGAGNLVYTFTRAGVTTGALTVNFNVGGTAAFGTDYTQTGAATFTGTTGTVTFAAGATTATVTIDPTADSTVEADETAILTVATGAGYNVAGTPATGTITNEDADVTLAIAPSSVTEDGAGNLVYTFTRTGYTVGALTVNFAVGGSATFNTDYTQSGAATYTSSIGTVTFAAGSSTATVTIDPTADTTVESDETTTLTLTSGTGYSVATAGAITGTITNDDTDVSLAVAPASVTEDGAGNLVYTFTRNGVTSNALTVNFSVGGGATFGTDYTQTGAATYTTTTGTVTFAAGSSTATVTIDPTADLTVEGNETAILTLTSGTGYNVTGSAATGTINNDDTDISVAVAPASVTEDGAGNLVYTFTRSGVTTGALTVNFSVGGTAAFGTDYSQTGAATFTASTGTVTFAAGATTATVTVDPTADSTVETDETAILTVTSGTGYNVAGTAATGNITNDDASISLAVAPSLVAEDGAGNLVYTFTRAGFTTNALTVNFAVGGTATFNTDYTQSGAATFTSSIGTVTFAAGATTATVTVDPTPDVTGEPNETVDLTITAGSGYGITTAGAVTGTIQNDDTTVTLAVSPASASETSGALTYTFTRTGDTSTATTVNFTYAGTSLLTNDYTQAGAATFASGLGTIVIPIGSNSATVTLTPVNDVLVEGSETSILTVAAGADYGIGAQNTATGTINDNDTATITYGSVSSSIGENGVNAALGFILTINANGTGTAALASDVTFNVTATGGTATGGGTDYALPATVTFASGALSGATQTANLAINNDRIVEGSETAMLGLTMGAQTAGGQVTIGGANSHTVTITDNDTATIGFASSTSSPNEGSGTNSVNLVLTIVADGSGPVSLGSAADVQLSTTGGTATAGGTDYTLPGVITFAAGAVSGATQSANIALINDVLVEGSEIAILGVAMGSNTVGGQVTIASGANSHTSTITDNDTATIGFATATSNVGEATGPDALGFVLTINANGTGTAALARDVTFNVTTAAGGTATGGGTDYTLPTTVTFASGSLNNATASANLTINNDTIVEGSEVANLGLAIGTDNTGGQVTIAGGAAANHATTITDNDTATIRLLSAGSSVAEGTASKDIGFELVITGNGTAGVGTLGSAVSVNFEQLINGTASLADITFTNPQNFTFAAGSASGQRTATIGIVNDTLVEGTEILDYRLSGLEGATGAVTLSGPAQHTLTITDNDTATIGFVQNSSTTLEDGTPTVGVVLTITANGQPNTGSLERAVSLNVASNGGTATSGTDYTFGSPQTITFAAGAISSTQNIALALNNDTIVEGSETIVFGASGLSDGTNGQVTQTATNQHTLTITDNDTAVVQFTQLTGSVSEPSEGANVGVTLVITANGQPNTGSLGQDVTVNVGVTGGTATGGGVDYGFTSPTTLTFAAGSLSGTRSANLSLNNDTRVEGAETIAFGLSSLNGPAGQVSLGAQTAHTLTITDNDTATVSLATGFINANEGSGTAAVNLVLTINANGVPNSGSLEHAVTVDLAAIAGSALGAGVDYSFSTQTVTFGVDSISSTKGADVTLVNDTILEFHESFAVNAQNFVDGTGSQVTFTGGTSTTINIVDNETATISFVDANSSVGEAGGNHQVGVQLTIIGNGVPGVGTLGMNTSAVISIAGGSAANGTDYNFTDLQTVAFSSGESSGTKFVTVGVVDDSFSEGNETVSLQLGNISDPSERGAITAGVPTTHTVTIVDNDIDLAVTKTATPTTVVAGSGTGNLTYTVTVTNNGLTNATNVVLGEDLTLPSGATFVSAAPSQGTYATNANPDGTWTIGTLAPGASATLTLTVTVDATTAEGTDLISNTATITGSSENRVNTLDDSVTATASVDRQVDISVSVTDGVTTAIPGDALSYIVGYANNGPSDALGVVLTQNLPAGTTFNAGASAAGWVHQGGGVYTLAVGNLASGATGNATFAVNVTNPAAAGLETITTTGTIADDLTAGADVVPGNNSATDIDTLNAAPDMRISIIDDPTTAHRGGVTKYLVSYANIGNQDATGGFITMTLPANTTFDGANSTGIWVNQGGGVYQLDLGNVSAGASEETAAFAVKLNSVLPGGYNAITTNGTVGNDGLNGVDTDLANNTDSETTPLYQGIYVVSNGVATPSNRASLPVLVFDVATNTLLHSIQPYESNYRDSVRVAVGDINGDGYDDIITSTRTGTGRVRVFDGVTGERFEGAFSEIAAFTEKGAKGAYVASGDVTGDGRDDIIVGAGQGSKVATVKVFDGTTGQLVSTSEPFGKKFKGGIRVAVGDVDGDLVADIVASQGYGGNDVVVTKGTSSTVLRNLEIGGSKYKGGVFVAVADLNNDGKADLIAGRDRGQTVVETFNGATGTLMDTIVPFDSKYRLGARVAAADLNLDGIVDIIVGSGGRNNSAVKIFNGDTLSLLHTFQAFPTNPTTALFVAASSPVPAQPSIVQPA